MYAEIPQFGKNQSAIFRMPDLKCTNEGDAKNWPAMHAKAGTGTVDESLWGRRKCPVHCEYSDSSTWVKWAKFRELYATTEDEHAQAVYMNSMLDCVTAQIPPPIPPAKLKTKTKTWHDIDGRPHSYEVEKKDRDTQVAIFLAFSLAVWVGLAVFGLCTLVSAL